MFDVLHKLRASYPLTYKSYEVAAVFQYEIYVSLQENMMEKVASAAIGEWDEYFLAMAEVVSLKSKDWKSRVGAVIVSPDNTVVSTGYNGLARGLLDAEHRYNGDPESFDDQITDGKTEGYISKKLRWICHAEQNAILNAVRRGQSVMGCAIYVNKFPCLACCNAIAQAGIKYIHTHDIKFWGKDPQDGDNQNHELKKQFFTEVSSIEVHAPFHEYFGSIAQQERVQRSETWSNYKSLKDHIIELRDAEENLLAQHHKNDLDKEAPQNVIHAGNGRNGKSAGTNANL